MGPVSWGFLFMSALGKEGNFHWILKKNCLAPKILKTFEKEL